MKLNPGEEVKYGEYWAEAVGDGDTVGGKEAVAFLGRAAKVSKGQLRRIWDIADHRKEGELGRDQFYIALRLLALAQRGAELSISGLRNFTGIQLIPNIAPLPKETPPEPAAPKADVFSWTVTADVVAKYDSFFKGLDVRKAGMIDGKQGVTFFGKSGLPRPTLKRIWELADVTRDGMLSLDEFRTAMHMVANIRSKKLTVTALPSVLDPNGPNWLRVEGQEPPAISDGGPPDQGMVASQGMPLPPSSPTGAAPIVLAPPVQPAQGMGQNHPVEQSAPIMMPPPPSPPQDAQQQVHQQAQQPMPPPMPPAQEENHMRARQAAAQDETEKMREALRQEQIKMEQTRREMEEMRAEMERMRIQQMSLVSAQTVSHSPAPAKSGNTTTSGQLPYQRQPVQTVGKMPPPKGLTPQKPLASASPNAAAQAAPIILGPPVIAAPAKTPPSSSKPARATQSQGTIRPEPISLGNGDDDIWDQPSPKASALPGPAANASSKAPVMPSGDSASSDDDDFWGGLGAKPTLGPAGGQKVGASSNDNKGFGGSELDDWVF